MKSLFSNKVEKVSKEQILKQEWEKVPGHFVKWSFCQLVKSTICHFFNLSNHLFVILSTSQFIILQFVNLSIHQFAILSTGQFIYLLFCQQVNSSILSFFSTSQFINLFFCQLCPLTCCFGNMPFHQFAISVIIHDI